MKYVLITGAYGGMGKKTTEMLVKAGYTVFALDKNVGEKTQGVFPVKADVTDVDDIKAAFDTVKKVTDELFAVIHMAGIYMLDSLVEIPERDFEHIFKVNLFGAFYVNKFFSPMLKNGSRIVMVTSELATIDPLPFTGIYAVTKSALDKYAFSLAMELQLSGIFVSVIRSGAVSTGMLNVSVDALDKFCNKTKTYACNAQRFKKIVDGVEAKSVSAEKIGAKTIKILRAKKPRFSYSLNRNKLLLGYNILPAKMQFGIIKKILK